VFVLLLTWFCSLALAGEELTVWHSYRGAERVAFEAVLDRFEADHPGLVVAPLAVPNETFPTKVQAAAPRGNGPDLFVFANDRIGGWVEAGILAPALVPDGLHPATVQAITYKGTTWGVPLAYKCLALFSRTDLIDRPPTTTDELEALATALTGPDRFGIAWITTEPYFHAAWQHGFGGSVFLDDQVQLDQPGNVASMAWVLDLQARGLLPEEANGALVTQLFNEGRAAMVVSGPWFLGELDPDLSFEVTPLPVVSATGQPAAPYLTVEAALVSAYADQPDLAAELATYLASTPAAIERAVVGRQSVATLAAYDDPRVGQDPILGAFRAQLDAALPMPNRPEMTATWEPMARSLRRVMRGAMTPGAAAAAAQKEYLIITKPPPPPANPTPYAVLVSLVILVGTGWLFKTALSSETRAQVRHWRFAYPYILPAALAMGVLVVVPFVVGAGVAFFSHRNGVFTFVGFANFVDILFARDWPVTSPLSFWFTLGVTVLWTAVNVFLHVSIGLGLALILREPWLRMRNFYRVLLILPWSVPNYITALIWKGMFHRQFGAINGLLVGLGLEPVSWFSHWSTAFAANVATNTWLGFPFMMVVTLGALQTIPRDLEQAAEVDGASSWQRFRHITLPLLKPALLPAVILGSVWTFNQFNIIYLVSGGEPDGGTEILISDAYRWAFTRNFRYGYAAAYSILIFGVLLAWSGVTTWLMREKST
jgi:arabinogalactan oligomer/maltooligosaccharide transport system permease protein